MRLLRYAGLGFAGLVSGLGLAVIFGQWAWLGMRSTTALAIPAGLLAGIFLGWWIKRPKLLRGVIGSELFLIAVMLGFFAGEADAWLILPGLLFREGFHLGWLSLGQANILLIVLVVVGNLTWLIEHFCTSRVGCPAGGEKRRRWCG